MTNSPSFDWRKFQFRLSISAINVVWGLNVVTGGSRFVGLLSGTFDRETKDFVMFMS